MVRRPYYFSFIKEIAFRHGKMAFVTGPRQVGKTTLAQQVLEGNPDGRYFTWDDIAFKRQWAKDPRQLIPEKIGARQTVVFDELHKAPRWKSTLKGVYDLCRERADIVVTGSARLDVFRRGGESLYGRYYLLRMHPFTLGEMEERTPVPDTIAAALEQPLQPATANCEKLFRFGGFPEPLLAAEERVWNLWRRSRIEWLIKGELLDLTRAHELARIETCAALLPERVGSPLSVQSLAEILDVSHPTANRWLHWFTQLFYHYAIPPYALRLSRAFKKQPKIYLADWSEVDDPAARFENMVACHLLKACHFWTDSGIGDFSLYYLRDKERREVDFLIVREKKPWLMVECKLNDTNPSPLLSYFASRLDVPLALQVVGVPDVQERFSMAKGSAGYVISADRVLRLL